MCCSIMFGPHVLRTLNYQLTFSEHAQKVLQGLCKVLMTDLL